MPQLESFDRGVDAALDQLAERANRGRIRLYGLGLADAGGGAEMAGERIWTREQQQAERSNVGQSLAGLASATGGVSLESAGDLAAVLRAARTDAANLYRLSWIATTLDAAARSRIAVVARDPSLVVRYRRSVPPRDPAAELADRTLATLLFGVADNGLDLKLVVESAESAEAASGGRAVQVLVTLPLARVALLPHGRLHEGSLHLLFGSLDSGGRLSDLHAVEAPIRIANEQLLDALGRVASYRARLTVRPVAQRLVVGVRDDVGGVEATTLLDWRPDEASTAPPRSGGE
jgi:hypothetical protein